MTEHRTCWNPEIETMPLDDVRAMQTFKLRRQLAYLVGSSPFYARKFAEAGFEQARSARSVTSPGAFYREAGAPRHPARHAAAWRACGRRLADVIRVHSSSGTTGRPSYIGITRADRERWTEVISRVYWCEGVRPDDVVIHGFGLGFFVGGLPLKDAIENIGATFVPIGSGASDRLVTSIGDLGGTVLTCTPSYAAYLAEFIRERLGSEPRDLGLKRILLGAEPGGGVPAVRARIADNMARS